MKNNLISSKNKIASPVSCHLGEKVLNNCAARLSKPHRPDMRLRRCQNSEGEKKRGKYMLSSSDPPMPSKAVKELNGKRKRDDKKAQSLELRKCRRSPGGKLLVQSVEHGENLVGERIKVWWPLDKKYYEGVVESFDCSEKKHTGKKIRELDSDLEDDDEESEFAFTPEENDSENTDFREKDSNTERHVAIKERLENENLETSKEQQVSIVSSEEALFSSVHEVELVQAGPAPREVSSPQSGIICVQGYRLKNVYAPILEALFKKLGDVASTCVFTDAAMRRSLLEAVCDIVRRIETNDVTNIMSSIKEIESHLHVAEAAKINVLWLRAHLEAIPARSDLKERHAKLVAAQNEFAEAERCVEVLKLMKKKLNNDVLESKAEKDLWALKPVELAREVFGVMPVKDVVLWSCMADGCVKSGGYGEALTVFMEMCRKGVEANEVTMVSVLGACAHLSALEQGVLMHRYVVEKRIGFTLVLRTLLVDMYAKCGAIDDALVFREACKKETNWVLSIRCIGEKGRDGDANVSFMPICGDSRGDLVAEPCSTSNVSAIDSQINKTRPDKQIHRHQTDRNLTGSNSTSSVIATSYVYGASLNCEERSQASDYSELFEILDNVETKMVHNGEGVKDSLRSNMLTKMAPNDELENV
ncbi:phospholipase-like protein [Tanacetum coccineum]